jgi:hypothetical protein
VIKLSGLMAVCLTFALSAPLCAEQMSGAPRVEPLGAALQEALRVVKNESLAGIFMFVDPQDAPAAFAAFLLRDHKALKVFVKRAEKDVKKVRAISRWDKYVFLHMVGFGLDGAMSVSGKNLSKKWIKRIQDLTLVPSLNYRDVVMKRGAH